MIEIVCDKCDWSGLWSDTKKVRPINVNEIQVCPECENEHLIDLDAVGPDDYEQQERRGHVTE